LQDDKYVWNEYSKEKAIEAMVKTAKLLNGMEIDEKSIKFYHQKQVFDSEKQDFKATITDRELEIIRQIRFSILSIHFGTSWEGTS